MKKKDHLKALLRSIDLDEPDDSFTDNIMKIVEAQDKPALQRALVPITRLVITRKFAWAISSAAILLFLLALAITHSNRSITHPGHYVTLIRTALGNATLGFMHVAGTILSYLIPLSILLLIDYLFRTRHKLPSQPRSL
jgi:hypothetical protein